MIPMHANQLLIQYFAVLYMSSARSMHIHKYKFRNGTAMQMFALYTS